METKKEKNYAKKPRNNVPFADKRETGDASNERKKIYIYIYYTQTLERTVERKVGKKAIERTWPSRVRITSRGNLQVITR